MKINNSILTVTSRIEISSKFSLGLRLRQSYIALSFRCGIGK